MEENSDIKSDVVNELQWIYSKLMGNVNIESGHILVRLQKQIKLLKDDGVQISQVGSGVVENVKTGI